VEFNFLTKVNGKIFVVYALLDYRDWSELNVYGFTEEAFPDWRIYHFPCILVLPQTAF